VGFDKICSLHGGCPSCSQPRRVKGEGHLYGRVTAAQHGVGGWRVHLDLGVQVADAATRAPEESAHPGLRLGWAASGSQEVRIQGNQAVRWSQTTLPTM
jgi:hypothetical protein